MATQNNPSQQEQQHPVVRQKSQPESNAAKKKGAGAKPEVVLDQFEIQHKKFFGK